MSGQTAFVEVADRVWTWRNPWLDVTSTVVAGEEGTAVVDTGGSTAQALRAIEEIRALGLPDVVAVVNTHWHFDHSFGNAAFAAAWPRAHLLAHEEAAGELARDGAQTRTQLAAPGHPDSVGHHADVAMTDLLVPSETFSASRVVDLGGRRIELLHLGAGHTAGDAVVAVPDASVVIAGDLVEESGPPCFGADSHPLEWPRTLDVLLGLLTDDTLVVPGHGAPVRRSFVEEQRGALGVAAETIAHLAATGVTAAQAVQAGEWPWPPEVMTHAVARGYAQLPRTARRLPLV